jgi:hypothetical protein
MVVVSFVLNAAIGIGVITPKGIHCPTAPVQQETLLVIEKDVSGVPKLVPLTRKPIPGELTFKQCQCAEKKQVEQKNQQDSKTVTKVEIPLVCGLNPNVFYRFEPVAIENALVIRDTTHYTSWPTEPRVQPPTA